MVEPTTCYPLSLSWREYQDKKSEGGRKYTLHHSINMDVKNRSNCSCDSSKYSPKAKWKLRLRLSQVELALFSLLLLPFMNIEVHGLSDYETCMLGQKLRGYALRGGQNAGKYMPLGHVRTFQKCVSLCCQRVGCEMAFMIKNGCFQVSCYDQKYCNFTRVRHSKYHIALFRRRTFGVELNVAGLRKKHHGRKSSEDTSAIESIERARPSCHHYHGRLCSAYVDKSHLIYYTTNSPVKYENKLMDSFSELETALSYRCSSFALMVTCNQWYPQCKDKRNPKPQTICKRDCLKMQQTVCKEEYTVAAEDSSLKALLPDCSKLQDEDGCINLDLPRSANDDQKVHEKRRAEVEPVSDTIGTTAPLTKAVTKGATKAIPEATTRPTTKATTRPTTRVKTATPTPQATSRQTTPALSTKLHKVVQTVPTTVPVTTSKHIGKGGTEHVGSGQKSETEAITPVTVKVTDSSEGTNLSEEEDKGNKGVTTSKPKVVVPTTSPVSIIKVSAGENKVITQPENKVSLYASPWPKPAEGVVYKYKWSQLAAPKKSQGYMEGKESSRLTLTMLDVPGVYEFKVEVTSKHAKGEGFVNVTVKPVPRVNRPPRADIQPREQTVTLPVKSVVLSGSKSTDDDKIVSYKWEEVKGPIADHEKTLMIGDDKEVLQIRNLAPGVYTFRLTVVDSDGEQDQTDATVTVNEEKDYPPVARAGDGAVLTLPDNQVTLFGNGSTDDKKIVKYEWTKTPDSPSIGDMLGTNKPILKLSNLVVGHYTFVLHVTDSAGQTSDGKVTVVVQPEKNTAPVAVAGPDKDLVYPDDSTSLDASKSRDDQHVTKFHWEQVSGPDGVVLSDANKAKLHLSGLKEGHYMFKVTVTDDKGLTGSDTVSINVKKDVNEPPVAKAGPDMTVILPDRAAVLDGSKSTDDQLISSYDWTRDGKSPAAGDILNNSNHQQVLRLTNLVEGTYTFTLTVTDNKGLKGSDSAIVTVKQDESSLYLVELYLQVDIIQFTEESKRQLLRKLAVILNVEDGNVVIQELRRAAYGAGLMLVFYVRDPNLNRKLDGQVVANLLKQKVGYHGTLFEYKMLKVEPSVCRNNCSGHGYCDRNTKQCVCDGFWMQDIFKALFGARESNCDWSILYVTVIAFGIIVAVIGLTWAFCFLYARRRRARRRLRYIPVHNDDDDTKDEIMMIPKGKYFAHSLTFTESDDDSEEETTVFDKKIIGNGSSYPNGAANGVVPRKSHAT